VYYRRQGAQQEWFFSSPQAPTGCTQACGVSDLREAAHGCKVREYNSRRVEGQG
jgi:hypothetical protein